MPQPQPLRRLLRQIDNQRQERSVEPEHVHPKAERRHVRFPLVPDLPHGQLTHPAVVKDSRPLAELHPVGHRGMARHRHRPAPEVRSPRPIRAQGLFHRIRSNQRQRQPMLRLMDHPVQLPPHGTRPAAPAPQHLRFDCSRGLCHLFPAPDRPLLQQSVQHIFHFPHHSPSRNSAHRGAHRPAPLARLSHLSPESPPRATAFSPAR